jgi:hypothetical protein
MLKDASNETLRSLQDRTHPCETVIGGIATLDHRLFAAIPLGWDTRMPDWLR